MPNVFDEVIAEDTQRSSAEGVPSRLRPKNVFDEIAEEDESAARRGLASGRLSSTARYKGGLATPANVGAGLYRGMHSDFATRLQQLQAAVKAAGGTLTITDGYRTRAQQADLYRRKPNLAAPPGRSLHEKGLAADLAGDLELAHRLAPQFGLSFPMLTQRKGRKYEPWHVELPRKGKVAAHTPNVFDQVAREGVIVNSDLQSPPVEPAKIDAYKERWFRDPATANAAPRKLLDRLVKMKPEARAAAIPAKWSAPGRAALLEEAEQLSLPRKPLGQPPAGISRLQKPAPDYRPSPAEQVAREAEQQTLANQPGALEKALYALGTPAAALRAGVFGAVGPLSGRQPVLPEEKARMEAAQRLPFDERMRYVRGYPFGFEGAPREAAAQRAFETSEAGFRGLGVAGEALGTMAGDPLTVALPAAFGLAEKAGPTARTLAALANAAFGVQQLTPALSPSSGQDLSERIVGGAMGGLGLLGAAHAARPLLPEVAPGLRGLNLNPAPREVVQAGLGRGKRGGRKDGGSAAPAAPTPDVTRILRDVEAIRSPDELDTFVEQNQGVLSGLRGPNMARVQQAVMDKARQLQAPTPKAQQLREIPPPATRKPVEEAKGKKAEKTYELISVDQHAYMYETFNRTEGADPRVERSGLSYADAQKAAADLNTKNRMEGSNGRLYLYGERTSAETGKPATTPANRATLPQESAKPSTRAKTPKQAESPVKTPVEAKQAKPHVIEGFGAVEVDNSVLAATSGRQWVVMKANGERLRASDLPGFKAEGAMDESPRFKTSEQAAAALDRAYKFAQKGKKESAIQKQKPDESVLRQESAGRGEGVELPGVGKGDTRPQEPARKGQALPEEARAQAEDVKAAVKQSRLQKSVDAIDTKQQDILRRARERQQKEGGLKVGVDPLDMLDAIHYTALEIVKGGLKGAQLAEHIVSTFGETFRERARQVIEDAHLFATKELGHKGTLEEVLPPETKQGTTGPEYAGSINLERLSQTPEQRAELKAQVQATEKEGAAQRRGVRTHEETREAAKTALSEAEILSTRPGTARSAEEVHATRALTENTETAYHAARQKAETNPSPENKAAAEHALRTYQQSLIVTQGVATEAGRALEAHKLLREAMELPKTRAVEELYAPPKTPKETAAPAPTRTLKGGLKLPADFGRENKLFTREKMEAARQRMQQKASRLSAGVDPSLLGDLVEVGGYYVEGGLRRFADWAGQMRTDFPRLSETDLQSVWAHVRAELSGRTKSPSLPSSVFVDALGQRIGREGARAFVESLTDADGSAPLLEKLITKQPLTPAERAEVAAAYRAAAPARKPGTPPPGMDALKAALDETRQRTPPKPQPTTSRKGFEWVRDLSDVMKTGEAVLREGYATYPQWVREMKARTGMTAREAGLLWKRLRTEIEVKSGARQEQKDFLLRELLKDIPPERVDAFAADLAKIPLDAPNFRDRLSSILYKYSSTTGQKIGTELRGILQTVQSGLDLSATLRQGAVGTLSHPVSALFRRDSAFVKSVQALGSREAAEGVLREIYRRPNAPLYEKAKLALTESEPGTLSQLREEVFQSRLVQKIPVIGAVYRASERAYSTYLNKLRADLFDLEVARRSRGGRTPLDAELAAIARVVNAQTGRGTLGKTFESAEPFLRAGLYAPRLMASRIELLGHSVGLAPKGARMMAAKDMLRFYSAVAALYTILHLTTDADVELDPRSSDFMKAKIGKTRYDLMGGMGQYVRAAAQFLRGERKPQQGGMQTLKPSDRLDVLARFARGKANPAVGMSLDLLLGENVVGEKKSLGDVPSYFTPLVTQDIKEAVQQEGLLGAAKTTPSIFGVGVQTYQPRPPAKRKPLTQSQKIHRRIKSQARK